MSWVQTRSGKAVDLFDTKPDTIDFEDIAHALSQICRFTGHTKTYYSVAQHCVLVAELLPESIQLYGLLHDAHEAYIGDINTVVKRALGAGRESLRHVMAGLDSAIHAAAGLSTPTSATIAAIKVADVQMLMAERRDLMSAPPRDWGEETRPARDLVEPWCAADAKVEFLCQYERLQNRHHMRADFLAH